MISILKEALTSPPSAFERAVQVICRISTITYSVIYHHRNLLLSSNLHVTEICYECRFENMSWFYNVFQKKFGITPKQYREKYSK